MSPFEAKQSLDKVIDKARIHLYKPIQIAEILHRARVEKDINLFDLETYRAASRKWRDLICLQFLGRISTSSARYQDDVFNDNATPPSVLQALGKENESKNGIVEAYIYKKFSQRFYQLSAGLQYCHEHNKDNFILNDFLSMFWNEPGLRRSIDKVYEIVVYALFSVLVEALGTTVEISIEKKSLGIFDEFEDFAYKVIRVSRRKKVIKVFGKINRAGITNAADRGLDMWSNFGPAIQVKHLSLTEELAGNIVAQINSDKIVIVCKDAEEKILLSVLNQMGWKSRIQSIVTENELVIWYEKALRGNFRELIGDKLLQNLSSEIMLEFPATNHAEFSKFYKLRGYDTLSDNLWM